MFDKLFDLGRRERVVGHVELCKRRVWQGLGVGFEFRDGHCGDEVQLGREHLANLRGPAHRTIAHERCARSPAHLGHRTQHAGHRDIIRFRPRKDFPSQRQPVLVAQEHDAHFAFVSPFLRLAARRERGTIADEPRVGDVQEQRRERPVAFCVARGELRHQRACRPIEIVEHAMQARVVESRGREVQQLRKRCPWEPARGVQLRAGVDATLQHQCGHDRSGWDELFALRHQLVEHLVETEVVKEVQQHCEVEVAQVRRGFGRPSPRDAGLLEHSHALALASGGERCLHVLDLDVVGVAEGREHAERGHPIGRSPVALDELGVLVGGAVAGDAGDPDVHGRSASRIYR